MPLLTWPESPLSSYAEKAVLPDVFETFVEVEVVRVGEVRVEYVDHAMLSHESRLRRSRRARATVQSYAGQWAATALR